MKMAEEEDTLRETTTMNQSLPMERLESQVSIDAGPMSLATSSQNGESPGCIHPTNPGKLLTLPASYFILRRSKSVGTVTIIGHR